MPLITYIISYLIIGIVAAAAVTGMSDKHESAKHLRGMVILMTLTWPVLVVGLVLYLLLCAVSGIIVWYHILKMRDENQ